MQKSLTEKTQQVLIHHNLLKNDLANLKSEVDKLDIGKLETNPTDLSELSNAVKNNFVKKTG